MNSTELLVFSIAIRIREMKSKLYEAGKESYEAWQVYNEIDSLAEEIHVLLKLLDDSSY